MAVQLKGRFLLKILDVRNYGVEDAGDGTEGTDRYYAEVVMAPDNKVKPHDHVSVRFKNNGIPPEDKHDHRFQGEIGEFDGDGNDIQSLPYEKKLVQKSRKGYTWKNPFEKKYRAIDCNGKLVNPEDVDRGLYFCLKCTKIVRWRKINNQPQFYHWPHYNENCPWSVKGEDDWNNGRPDPDNEYNDHDQIWIDSIYKLYENGLLHLLEGNENIHDPIRMFLDREKDIPDDLRQELERFLFGPPPPQPLGYDDYLNMVRSSGSKLKDVPDEYRDEKMCKEAVKNNPRALQFVPEKLLDKEMFLTAFGNNPSEIDFFWDLLSYRKIFETADEFGVAEKNKHEITWSYDQLKHGEKI